MPALEPDFYVGYQPTAPKHLVHSVRRVVWGLLLVGASLAALIALSQAPFISSRFEFQQYRDHEGTLFTWPYPLLATGGRQYLLVAEGKHGVAADGLGGRKVSLRGSLIEHGEDRMLEIVTGTLKPNGPADSTQERVHLGPLTLTGEIVDTKCYFGVMNPGRGKVHRDCAARCLSGGIPPGFLVRDAEGRARTLILTGLTRRELLPHAGEPVTIAGELIRTGSSWILETKPGNIRVASPDNTADGPTTPASIRAGLLGRQHSLRFFPGTP